MPMRIFQSVARVAARIAMLTALGLTVPDAAVAADAAAAAVPATGAIAWPAKVNAIYSITFNGLEFGKFVFKSDTTDAKYTIDGDAKLSAMFGAFSWRGLTKSVGAVSSGRPLPAAYAFSYDGGEKKGRIDMWFKANAVDTVKVIPPPKPGKKIKEVTKEHLKGVLDPLSAIMALSVAPSGKVVGVNPCLRPALPIFDGKQRFDLTLTSKRREIIKNSDGTTRSVAFVCGVKYQPISGYSETNQETKYMASNDGIEVWMVPVPQARIFVPYEIILPTWAGEAVLTSDTIRIYAAGGGVVAVLN